MKKYMTSIYLNLTRKCWSLQTSKLPVQHAERKVLKDVLFYVNESGRQKVIREQKKYVHAYIKTKLTLDQVKDERSLTEDEWDQFPHPESDWVRISYNPFKHPFFYRVDTGQEVLEAEWCVCLSNNTVSCQGLREGKRNINE